MSDSVVSVEENLQDKIDKFIGESEGLSLSDKELNSVKIKQSVDQKSILLNYEWVEDVIERVDPTGKQFLQLNLSNGKKLLLTNNLIGFKPVACKGLDMTKLPKVVTTPDLISVFEAIEDSMENDYTSNIEVDVLKKVFKSVILGGESIGFDLHNEKTWLAQIDALRNKFIA